jgi:hypothetical protein
VAFIETRKAAWYRLLFLFLGIKTATRLASSYRRRRYEITHPASSFEGKNGSGRNKAEEQEPHTKKLKRIKNICPHHSTAGSVNLTLKRQLGFV